ncbi:MAG: hypothetical protein IJ234_11600 [Clostridia bacterium]|nr:hypothetical protein [Clostridia bacterium]
MIERIWHNSLGKVRACWVILMAALACVGLREVAALALFWVLRVCFDTWGVTASNFVYAPAWARLLWVYGGVLSEAVGLIVGICLATHIARRFIAYVPKERRSAWTLTGAGFALAIVALALSIDSMRLERPLAEPVFNLDLLPGLLYIAARMIWIVLLCQRIAYGLWADRGHYIWARMGSAVLFAAIYGGGWVPMRLFGALIMGISLSRLYERYGIRCVMLALFGWEAVTRALFSWGTERFASLYTLYPVSDAWLCGGMQGAIAGVAAWLLWGAVALVLYRSEIRILFGRIRSFRNVKLRKPT